MNKHNIKVGQIIYKRASEGIKEETVEKVGKKFFYTGKGYNESKYKLCDLTEVLYNGYNQAYLNKQLLKDEMDESRINDKVRGTFRDYGKSKYTVDQLRRIEKILDEGVIWNTKDMY